MANFQQKFFKLRDGLSIATKIWGPFSSSIPQQRRILALHGWLDNAASFDKLAPPLVDAGFTVVAMDLPGHGLSSHRSLDVLTQSHDYLFYTKCLAEELGWDKFTIIGHSLGASVSISMAGVFPEKIDKCVCIEALGFLSAAPERATTQLRESIEMRSKFIDLVLSKKLPKVYKALDEAVQARLQTLRHLPGTQTMSYNAALTLVSRGTTQVPEVSPTAVRFLHDPRLLVRSPIYPTEEQVQDILQHVTSEVLLIFGRNGWLSPERAMERISLLQRYSSHLLDGSHHLHLDEETCQPVIEAVLNFFDLSKPTTI